MSARGHYGNSRALVGNGDGDGDSDSWWNYKPTPAECLSRTMFPRQAVNDPRIMPIIAIGTLVVVGIGGLVGLGIQAFSKPKTSIPATTSQKVARVGLVGAVVGAGAYAYFADQKTPATPPPAPAGRRTRVF